MDASPDTLTLQGCILGRGHFSKYLMAGTRSQAHILRYAATDLSEEMKPMLLKTDLHPPRGEFKVDSEPQREQDRLTRKMFFFGRISRN